MQEVSWNILSFKVLICIGTCSSGRITWFCNYNCAMLWSWFFWCLNLRARPIQSISRSCNHNRINIYICQGKGAEKRILEILQPDTPYTSMARSARISIHLKKTTITHFKLPITNKSIFSQFDRSYYIQAIR